MELDQDLIDILRCPRCKGELKVQDESFVCEACSLRYAVVEGIPNFIVEEAKPLSE